MLAKQSILRRPRQKYAYLIIVLLISFRTNAVQAEMQNSDWERTIKLSLQAGTDSWDLRAPDKSDVPLKGVDNLFLANSNTQWNYRNTAPWVKVDGYWSISNHLAIVYKLRAEQSVGTKVDDLHFDFNVSPYLGFRAGVVDYKTSWCRTYDVDSPWVRENDPFCTTQTTNAATLAAPGLQTYLVFAPGHYQIQALAGVYRPKAFGYNPQEFSNVTNTNGVAINDRWGWSVNALNLDSGAEFRLSWLGARQENNREVSGYRAQNAGAWYLGASLFPIEKLDIRASELLSSVDQASYDYAPDYTQILDTNMIRKSKAIEFIYQFDDQDMFAYAISKYTHHWDMLGMNGYESYTNPNYVQFYQTGRSVAWRHDWIHSIYTAIQWSHSANAQQTGNTKSSTAGNALGLRLGFIY